MFGRNSRYHGSDTVAVPDESGRSVQMVKLRPLPAVSGEATTVRSGDQLDVMSDRRYQDRPTWDPRRGRLITTDSFTNLGGRS